MPFRDRGDAPENHHQTFHEGGGVSGEDGLREPLTMCGSLGQHRGGDPHFGVEEAGVDCNSAGRSGVRGIGGW